MSTVAELLAYDEWATVNAFEPLKELSDDQFIQPAASDGSSIRQQAIHIVLVADRYRSRIMDEPVPDFAVDSFPNVAALEQYRAEVAERMRAMLLTLTPQRIGEELRSDTKRGLFIATVEETLMHVVNHGTYHRGQIACMLKTLEIEPVDTDYVIWINDIVRTK